MTYIGIRDMEENSGIYMYGGILGTVVRTSARGFFLDRSV